MVKVKEFLDAYKSNLDEAVNMVWYDWFCSDASLKNRTKNIAGTLKKIRKLINIDNYEVSFKNCCPINGPTYDNIILHPHFDKNTNVNIRFFSCHDDHAFTVGVYNAKTEEDYDKGTNNRNELAKLAADTILEVAATYAK